MWIVNGRIANPFFPRYKTSRYEDLLRRFLQVRCEKNREKKIGELISLISTDDVYVINAASNALEGIVRGGEREWKIKPPDNANWSYDEYYQRNAYNDRTEWLKWWSSRSRKMSE